MKSAYLKAIAAAFTLSTALAGTAQAQVVGASSDTAKVKIAASTVSGGPHVAGRVGINVPSLTSVQYVDFQGLQAYAAADANGVTSVAQVTGTVTDHSKYGRFDFAKVGTQDVYFGEWSQTGSATAGDHTVYYGGTGQTSAVPNSGAASYSVKGISDYANKGILTGTFNATFTGGGTGILTGSLSNASGSYGVNIGTAGISGGAFSGTTATATSGATTVATNGAVSGSFFGTNADALAGIVNFASARQYNTAFGGTKN